ncbi:hypothetical protein [Sinorhizobium meliloti]|uniref:hypothetical protein n=1 Tax=Rhizobium meliloti TaxID=382 RepID=UPI001F3549FE|nr:hypothetical protein [Sinorhizobium meliloti]
MEQIDRLTRLNLEDWDRLRTDINAKQVLIVSLDLPTSWTMMTATRDDIQARIFQAINNMMLDVLAALPRRRTRAPIVAARKTPSAMTQSWLRSGAARPGRASGTPPVARTRRSPAWPNA